MRKEWLEPFFRLHWTARAVMKYGVMLADVLLLTACFVIGWESGLAFQMVQMSVYVFGEAVIGGLLLDVIAKRME